MAKRNKSANTNIDSKILDTSFTDDVASSNDDTSFIDDDSVSSDDTSFIDDDSVSSNDDTSFIDDDSVSSDDTSFIDDDSVSSNDDTSFTDDVASSDEISITNKDESDDPPVTMTGTVTTRLNIRENDTGSPDTTIVSIVNRGEEITVYPEEGNATFFKVKTKTGVEGYAMRRYIIFESE